MGLMNFSLPRELGYPTFVRTPLGPLSPKQCLLPVTGSVSGCRLCYETDRAASLRQQPPGQRPVSEAGQLTHIPHYGGEVVPGGGRHERPEALQTAAVSGDHGHFKACRHTKEREKERAAVNVASRINRSNTWLSTDRWNNKRGIFILIIQLEATAHIKEPN